MLYISKALKGKEFLHSRYENYQVPRSSAEKICQIMNEARFELKDGEVWHIYEGPELDVCINGTARMYKGSVKLRRN